MTITLFSIIRYGPASLYRLITYQINKYFGEQNNTIEKVVDKNVVILVHGRGGTPSCFQPLITYFNGLPNFTNNYSIYTVDLNLSKNTRYTSVEEDTINLDNYITQNFENCRIILVGNSKGGAVVAKYLATFDNMKNNNINTNNNEIKKIITVSSPVKGSVFAPLASGIAKTDLAYNNDDLIQMDNLDSDQVILKFQEICLEKSLENNSSKIYHIVSKYDHLILPYDAAYFYHVPNENIYFYDGLHNHCCLLDDIIIQQVIYEWIIL